MALEIVVTCSMCGGLERRVSELRINVDGPKELDPQALKKAIENHGWIVQFNGDYMDTYCTKKCAE